MQLVSNYLLQVCSRWRIGPERTLYRYLCLIGAGMKKSSWARGRSTRWFDLGSFQVIRGRQMLNWRLLHMIYLPGYYQPMTWQEIHQFVDLSEKAAMTERYDPSRSTLPHRCLCKGLAILCAGEPVVPLSLSHHPLRWLEFHLDADLAAWHLPWSWTPCW